MTTPSQEIESSLIDEVPRRHLTMTGDTSLPKNYHLEGGANYGVWAYQIKNLLLKYGRFHYCITAPSKTMSEEEKTARQQVLSIINSNAKNNALNILRRYDDPYECWTGLKKRYESDSGPRRVMLIDRIFCSSQNQICIHGRTPHRNQRSGESPRRSRSSHPGGHHRLLHLEEHAEGVRDLQEDANRRSNTPDV